MHLTGFSPIEPMTVTLSYLNLRFAEKNYLGSPTTSKKWADDLNLFVDYVFNENTFIHAGVGMAIPDDGAKEINDDNKNAYFSQIWLTYSF